MRVTDKSSHAPLAIRKKRLEMTWQVRERFKFTHQEIREYKYFEMKNITAGHHPAILAKTTAKRRAFESPSINDCLCVNYVGYELSGISENRVGETSESDPILETIDCQRPAPLTFSKRQARFYGDS